MKAHHEHMLAVLVAGVVAGSIVLFVTHATSDTRLAGTYELERPTRADLPSAPVFEDVSLLNEAWVAGLPLPKELNAEEDCLAEALYFEARGETVRGQMAVAEVIMNRAADPSFPDSICGVIYQGSKNKNACQFSYTCDGVAEEYHEPVAYDRAKRLAAYSLEQGGWGFTRGAIYYHTHAVSPSWAKKMKPLADIGDHLFLGPEGPEDQDG